jgi:hypothetical protein
MLESLLQWPHTPNHVNSAHSEKCTIWCKLPFYQVRYIPFIYDDTGSPTEVNITVFTMTECYTVPS